MSGTDAPGGVTAAAPAPAASSATAPNNPAAARAAARAAVLAGAANSKLTPSAAAAPADPPAASAAATPAVVPDAAAPPAAEPSGMDAVRRAEQHMRRQLADERAQMRADLDRERAVWQRQLDEIAPVKKSIAEAKRDRIAAIKALGFEDADFEGLAREIFAHSPEGQKDPRHKATAETKLREREQMSAVEKLQAELAELKNGLTAKEQAVVNQRRAEAYVASVVSAATDETPLAKAALAKAPDKTQAMLYNIALELYAMSGETDADRTDPAPLDVLRAYDKIRAAELEELGIDPRTLGRSAAPPPGPGPATAPPEAPSAPAPGIARPSRSELLAGLQKHRAAQRT